MPRVSLMDPFWKDDPGDQYPRLIEKSFLFPIFVGYRIVATLIMFGMGAFFFFIISPAIPCSDAISQSCWR